MRGSKADMEKSFEESGIVMREAVWGDMHVCFETYREPLDTKPLDKDCPDGRCQCPHWGYVMKGQLRVLYADYEETIRAGDAFYIQPGHNAVIEADTETVMFSPNGPFMETMEIVARTLQAMKQ